MTQIFISKRTGSTVARFDASQAFKPVDLQVEISYIQPFPLYYYLFELEAFFSWIQIYQQYESPPAGKYVSHVRLNIGCNTSI
jgi:hypothetical protein